MTDDWPSIGTRLALRYRLVAPIEQGGMAVVWRANDELLCRHVAVKLLSGESAGDVELFDLVRREARAAAKLSHPNITAVHDYAEALRPDGSVTPFVVMELLEGEALAVRLQRGPLGWTEAAAIGAQVADALAAAHEGGVVHRDVTPGNVMLTNSVVKVVDFGICAAIGEPDEDSSGATFGTPAYVAPERLDGQPALPATDVYALGALLYELVTGEPPYPVNTWEELANARVHQPRELPAGVPSRYSAIVWGCLAARPADRPAAADVARDLHELSRSRPRAATGIVAIPAAAQHAERRAVAFRQSRRPPWWVRRRRQGGPTAITIGLLLAGTVATADLAGLGWPPARRAVTAPPAAAPPPATASSGPSAPDSSTTDGPAATPRQPSPAAPTVTAPVPISTSDAVHNFRAAVVAGREAREIRPDVATDLLNTIDSVDGDDALDVGEVVGTLRRKIKERVREKAVARTRAALLDARLTGLAESAAR
jgi:hypothetical protein